MSRRQLQEQEILKPKFPHVLLPENWKSFKKTLKHEWEWTEVFTARKRSLGQGNIFAPVCHSVHRGGGTWAGTPRAGTPPGRYTPSVRVPTRTGKPGKMRRQKILEKSGNFVSPKKWEPCRCMLGYGEQAGGTHPTGMHSCFLSFRNCCVRCTTAVVKD